LAAGAVYFPLLLFPAWLGFYWRRGAGRFAAAFALTAGLCLAIVGVILWQNAELYRSLESVLSLSDWQPWVEPDPRTSHSFWTGLPAAGHRPGDRLAAPPGPVPAPPPAPLPPAAGQGSAAPAGRLVGAGPLTVESRRPGPVAPQGVRAMPVPRLVPSRRQLLTAAG